MPELIDVDSERDLVPGDVIQVARAMRSKETNKPYTWRFFAVVTYHTWQALSCIPFGAISDKRKDEEMDLTIGREGTEIYYLAPEEWPDGVHANRLRMILTGLVKII